MKNIGIIIGSNTSFITTEYYNKNKHKLKHLKDIEKNASSNKERKAALEAQSNTPYDYAIFCEIKHLEKKHNSNVIPIYGPTITLDKVNQCDYLFCLYESSFSFMDQGSKGYNNYMNIMKKTTAKVYPSYEVQNLIVNKQKYMKYLEKKGYNLIPTKFYTISNYSKNPNKVSQSINKFINDNEYKQIIMKPELAAFAIGFKRFKILRDDSFKKYFTTMKEHGYKKILVQPYVNEFLKFWEIKTYWLNGKFTYAYGTKVGSGLDDEIPVSDGGSIPDKLISKYRKLGESIIKDIFSDYGNQIQLRIDFGCCIDNDNVCREYFVNEIECAPTLEDDESIKDNFRLLANAVFNHLKL